MAPRAKVSRLVLLAGVLLASGCDGFFHDAAPPAPAELALTTAFSTAGPVLSPELAAAFDQTNRVGIRVVVVETGEVLVDEFQSVVPEEEGIRLQLRIDLPEPRVQVRVFVALFRDSQLLFEGNFVTELVQGQAAGGEVPLVPRPARLNVNGPTLLDRLQQSVQLEAELLMATGDPIPDAGFNWVALDPTVVAVNGAGVATSVSEGEGRVVAVSQGLADTLSIRVAATVASVEVTPPEAQVAPGEQAAFQAVVRDEGGSVLSRTVAWSTSNAAVASITQAGVATGSVPGEVQVRAAVGPVAGTAVLRVLPPPPSVTTGEATGVSANGATLQGTANPSGSPAEAWFEFGTSSTLATFESTARVSVGSGTSPVSFQEFVGSLEPETTVYFRAAAGNAGGEARGIIRSFTTPSLRPPFAPTGLNVEARVNSSESFLGFLLTWNDNSNNEDHFEVERQAWAENGYSLLQIVPANVSDAFDADQEEVDGFYYSQYRVRACNVAGCSNYSNIATGYYSPFEGGGYYREEAPRAGARGTP